MARLFIHFERPELLKIFMPKKHILCVDLSRFELLFQVNKSKRLEIKLGKEFDPDQDAGTPYGLLSKIVLRDTADRKERTVIVPLGLNGPHVKVVIVPSSANAYTKYEIDDVLGRLTCPPEPALLYTKARLQASTSFPIPDKLTGRTGTEEAVHILRSGMSQPWAPLGLSPISEVEAIAALYPRREFYPEDKRSFQKMQWLPTLTVSIQHESLETLARNLLRKSHRLQPFADNTPDLKEVDVASHLRRRAEMRRSVYDPASIHPRGSETSIKYIPGGKISNSKLQPSQCAPDRSNLDRVYVGRDQGLNSEMAMNVKHIVKSTLKRPFLLSKRMCIRSMLIGQQIIGGFQSGTKLLDETDALDAVLEVWQRKMNINELGAYIDEVQENLKKFVTENTGMVQETQRPALVATLLGHVPRTRPVILSVPLELLSKAAGTLNLTLTLDSPSVQFK